MSEPEPVAAPRCLRCGAELRRTPMPPSVFGVQTSDACVDCSDGTPTREEPWMCPSCGNVYLLDAACRIV